MKKCTSFLLVLLGVWGTVCAQSRTVTGIVTDPANRPLPGASVREHGTQNGGTTDEQGRFTLVLQQAASLLDVSFVGFVSTQVQPAAEGLTRIQLKPDASGLNEIVVVGYGTQKKIDLTGSVASVSGDALAKRPVMRASAALEGLASGLTVTQTSGQPGADGGTMRVRGIGTLGNSDPLVLIDGVEGSLDGVDPHDIEDISVLKDAASASIYGSRAANGVILVTTKTGKADRLRVEYNAYFGWQRFTDLQDFSDGYTYMQSLNQAYLNEGRDPLYSEEYLQEYREKSKTDPDHFPDVDWQKAVYTGSGFLQHHYVGVTGGSERLRVMGSVAYQDQRGEVPGYLSQRYSFRLNTQTNIARNFQVRFNLSGRHSPTQAPSGGTGTYGVISEVIRQPPVFPARLSDGRFGVGWAGTNPLARALDGGYDNDTYESFQGTLQANYQPFAGMDIELNFSPQYSDVFSKSFFKAVSTYEADATSPSYTFPAKSTLTEAYSRSWENTAHLLLRYQKTLQQHHVELLGGYEQITYRNDQFNAFRDDYPLPDYQELNSGSVENWKNGGTASEWALRSYFGRLNYNFAGRYLLNANLRVDGSSRFAAGNRYGVFPSFSAGWRLSEEAFLQDVGWLSNLKLRASWGELGNQLIGTYPFASVVNLGVNYVLGGAPATGAAQTDMSNRDISWESSTTKDIGLDLGLLQDRISFSFDYYVRNTTGILLQLPIPAIIGLAKPYQNAGAVRNTGWDLELSYAKQTGAFHYRIGFNLSDVINEVTDLKGTGPYISTYSVVQEGEPIDALFGYQAIGLFQTQDEVDKSPTQFGNYAPGDIRYKDLSGDNVINADDRTVLGNQIPRLNFGLDFSAGWKGFDLNVLIQGVGKRDIFLYKDAVWAFYNAGKIQRWQLDYWTPDNPDAKYPRLVAQTTHNNFQNSSYWVYDASYARLKNVQIGYTFPEALLGRTFLNQLRLYVSGQDIFTLDHMPSGWDPERKSGDASVYPITSTYVFGLSLSF